MEGPWAGSFNEIVNNAWKSLVNEEEKRALISGFTESIGGKVGNDVDVLLSAAKYVNAKCWAEEIIKESERRLEKLGRGNKT